MRRSHFFLILVAFSVIFALPMVFAADTIARMSGVESSPAMTIAARSLGMTLLGLSVLNFLVRNHPDSPTLAAVLWGNFAIQILLPVGDLVGYLQGIVPGMPGLPLHLLAALGCFIYARRIRPAA